ncbi:MAG: hypothetical protein ACYC49_04400 [Ignavibacteriaceae bacterium]
MKNKYVLLLSIIIITVILFNFGCKNQSNNPLSPANFTGSGQDYFPVTSNKQVSIKVSGSATLYDSLGRVTNMQQISGQTYSGYFGTTSDFKNMNATPVYAYNNNGNSTIIGFYSNNNGEIVGTDNNPSGSIVTLLPNQLNINDVWIVNPQSPVNQQVQIKLIEALDNYTNSAGKSYSNVINLLITYNYNDSTNYSGNGYYYYSYSKEAGSINLYLAKGIGIIGATLNNFEEIYKYNEVYSNNFYSSYSRAELNGTAGVL